jgi:hypothetical protein
VEGEIMAKRKTRTGAWAKDEVKQLRKIFRNSATADVARELGRSLASVQAKATALGLTKTKTYLRFLGRS